MKNQTVLLFDIGNVFLFAEHKITHDYLVSRFNVPLEKAKKFFTIPEYKLFQEGKINEDQFVSALRNVLGQPNLSKKSLKKAHDIHMVRVIDSALDVLKKIYNQGIYKIAFLTNTNDWQNEREKELFDFSKFSKIIVRSNEEGYTKKTSQLFLKTLKRIGKAEKIIFIDDKLDNIKVAKSLGIPSIHVEKNGKNLGEILKDITLQSR